MMNSVLSSLILLSLTAVHASALSEDGTGRAMSVILDLDREMAGLLDAYLEAVPECPLRSDTPVRNWVLDLAWLRAGAAMERAEQLDLGAGTSVEMRNAWRNFLYSSREYMRIYHEITQACRDGFIPDSSFYIDLEDRLLACDSIWSLDEEVLFEILAEEGVE